MFLSREFAAVGRNTGNLSLAHDLKPSMNPNRALTHPHLPHARCAQADSWHDSPNAKWAALSQWAEQFEREHGREPLMWIDKV